MARPRGFQRKQDGRDWMRLFPVRSGDYTRFVYAIGLKGGVVKVGSTSSPQERMRQHWTGTDGPVEWAHLFAPQLDRAKAFLVERKASVLMREKFGQYQNHREAVVGADRGVVLRDVRALIAALAE